MARVPIFNILWETKTRILLGIIELQVQWEMPSQEYKSYTDRVGRQKGDSKMLFIVSSIFIIVCVNVQTIIYLICFQDTITTPPVYCNIHEKSYG